MTSRRISPVLLFAVTSMAVVALLAGCASVPSAPTDAKASAVAGAVRLNVSGVGYGNFSADANVHGTYTWGAVIGLSDSAAGESYQTTTSAPDGQFLITNVAPGTYTIEKLWCQVQTSNSWVTLSTSFKTPPSFQVAPHAVANLGLIEWTVSYDLTDPRSASSVAFGQDFSGVKGAITKRVSNTAWSTLDISDVTVSSEEARPTSSVTTLMPRTGGRPYPLTP